MKCTIMAFCIFLLFFSIIIPSTPVRDASATPSLREGPFKIVAIGDSLMWGQGLSQFEKFHYLVRERLEDMLGGRGVEVTVLAHSGAVIGANESIDINDPERNLHGEIPRPQPTIRELMNMYTGDPQDVDLVLIDGCINDITGRWVASSPGFPAGGGPLGGINFKDLNMRLQFREEISEFCYGDMKVLLQEAASKFNNRETRIVVTGYYQVISDRTDFRNAAQIFQRLTSGTELTDPVISPQQMTFNWQLFQMDSNRALKRAVNEVNIELWNAGNQPSSFVTSDTNSILAQPSDGQRPGTGNPFQHVNPCLVDETRPVPARIAFACPRFTADNAMYAPNSFIFQLDRALAPTDSVSTERMSACDAIEHETLQDFFACNVASTGHANQNGALAYADAIMATFSDNFIRLHKWDRVRVTLLDATFTDHTHPSHRAGGTIWLSADSHRPNFPATPVQMTSGVPITFTQGPFVELPVLSSVNIRVNLVGSIADPDFGGDIIEEDPERPRPIRPQSTTITVSNSHMITDSNFEGVHSASTRGTVNDRLGSSHEISFTITYRIESMNR